MEDLEIIQNLIEYGPEFLMAIGNDRDKRLNYEKLYLLEDTIFEDNFVKYINCLESHNLWTNELTEKLDESMCNITIKLMNCVGESGVDISQKMKLIHRITEPKCIQNLFAEKNYSLWDSFLFVFLNDLRCDSGSWPIEIKKLQLMIRKIITNKNNSRNIFVMWCSEILNICIQKIHIDFGNYNSKLPTDYFLINMLALFLHFWIEGINEQRLKLLEYDYITSENCPIKWMDKKKNNTTNDTINKEYTFLNQILFLILDTIRVGYIPTLHRTKTWNEYLKYIDDELKKISNNNQNPLALGYIVSQLKKQRKIIVKHLNMGKIITTTQLLNEWINNFYYMITKWIKEQGDIGNIIDDMLYDYVKFFIHTNNIAINSEIISFGIEIVGSKKYTANIDTRIEFAIFVGKKIREGININFEQYTTALITSHNDLHSAHIRVDYKFMKKQEIYNLISGLCKYKQYELTNSLKDNLEMTKKFLNILLMDLSECNDTIDEFHEKLILKDITDEEKEDYESGMINILKYYITSLVFFDEFLTKIMGMHTLVNIIKSKEISSAIAIVINYIIFTYSACNDGPNSVKYEYSKGSSKINYSKYLDMMDVSELLNKIGGILATLNIIEYDFTYIIDGFNFDLDIYINFNKITTYDITDAISNIKIKMKELENKQNDEMDIDYSDEFFDPITYTLIDEPCLLPDMVGFSGGDVYFDRSTIIKQLLIKDENPYTRKQLTIGQFNEFNKRPEIMEKLENFKKKFSQEKEIKKNNKKIKI